MAIARSLLGNAHRPGEGGNRSTSSSLLLLITALGTSSVGLLLFQAYTDAPVKSGSSLPACQIIPKKLHLGLFSDVEKRARWRTRKSLADNAADYIVVKMLEYNDRIETDD